MKVEILRERIRKLQEDLENRDEEIKRLKQAGRDYLDASSNRFKKIRELIEQNEYSKEELLDRIYEIVE